MKFHSIAYKTKMMIEMIRDTSFRPFLPFKEVKSKLDGIRDNTNHGIRNTFVTVAVTKK